MDLAGGFFVLVLVLPSDTFMANAVQHYLSEYIKQASIVVKAALLAQPMKEEQQRAAARAKQIADAFAYVHRKLEELTNETTRPQKAQHRKAEVSLEKARQSSTLLELYSRGIGS